ncbi:MAG: hypothetical protein P857_169 [Candidatus Xenolissoclinum pacificiensis L6]|uniref:Magnesium transporter MgtE intracellular domain-containing protein n=1 Tax=Candidatus Xenolissoclinum pacificiensis L6 TaxID=1401685 RepID=W2UZC9_9RICK|nr:MAG: hypothetical protein P857_169 [Candidatus Xenolissoclinum pacificiensis L6]
MMKLTEIRAYNIINTFFVIILCGILLHKSFVRYQIFSFNRLIAAEQEEIQPTMTLQDLIDQENEVRANLSTSDGEISGRILESIERRRAEVMELERDMQQKSNVMDLSKDFLATQIQVLTEVRDEIRQLLRSYEDLEENNIRSIVKVYESMKPQEAAMIFDNMSVEELLPIMYRMKEIKLSAIMAKMKIRKAKALTIAFSNQTVEDITAINCSCSL